MADNEVSMIMSVYPGAMTGFSAMYAGVSSINNIFMQTMSRIDDNFNILDSSIIGTGALLAQVGMKAMDAYGQMEQSMKIVQMVSGQTADDIGYLSQKANEFSVQYRTDIDQITEGLQTLGRAGLNSAAEQSQVLENGLTTAKLEGRELNSVLEELIQNTALLGGDLKSSNFGEDSQYVNDLLVATSMTAPIDTHDVSETLKYSGGIAAAAGANIESAENKAILEDYMGAIAAFAQKGVSGSIAGTALRAFFNKPASQDSSVIEGLAAIKLKPEYLWEDDQQTMKPISEQIGLIQNQMDKLNISTMDRLQIWSKIVGGKMGQQMMKLDSSDIKSLTSDIRAADSAEKLAAGSMKTYEANVKAAQESFAGLERNVGEVLVKYVNPLLEFGNKILGFLNNDFSASVLAVSFIGFMGIVLSKVKGVFGTIKSEISEVWTALKGGNQVNVRDMRGDTKTGKRKPLSALTVEGAQTPAQIKAAFEKKFAQDSMDIYKNWDAIDIAVNEQTKGWSAQTKNKGLLKAGEKYGFSTRDSDMIRSLLEHKKMSDEVKTILASKGNKSFKMGSVLESGQTVNEYIEEEYKKLQAEINQAFSTAHKKTKELDKKIDSFFDTDKTGKDYLEKKHGVKSKQDEDLKNKKEEVVQSTQKEISSKEKEKKANEELAFWIEKVNDASEEAIIKKQLEYDEKVNNYGGQAPYLGNKNIPTTPDHVIGSYTSINPAGLSVIEGASDWMPDPLIVDFWKYYQETYSTKRGSQKFYWSSPELGLQVDPTKYIQNHPEFIRAFMQGVLPEITFEDFKQMTPKNKTIPKAKMMDAYATYMQHISSLLDDHIFEQIKTRDIKSLSAQELQEFAPRLSNNFVSGWRGPNTRSAEDVRNELIAYNYMKGLTVPTLAKMLREYGTDIGAGRGINKDDRIRMLLPLMAKDLKEHNNLLTERLKLYKELEKAATLPGYVDPNKLHSNEVQKALKKQEEQVAAQNSYTPGHVSPTVIEDAKRKNEAAKKEKELKDKLLIAQNQANAIQKEINEVQEKTNNEALKEKRQRELELFRRKKEERDNYVNVVPSSDELRKRYGVVTQPTPVPWEPAPPDKIDQFVGGIGEYLRNTWNQDRSGRFNFGVIENAEGELVSTTKGLRGFGNGILNLTDIFGGPLMAASIAFSIISQTYNYYLQEFTKSLQEASNELKEAYAHREEAESNLSQAYRDMYPDATSEEIEQLVLDVYTQQHEDFTSGNWLEKAVEGVDAQKEYEYDQEADDGSYKEKEIDKTEEENNIESIEKNTGAIYVATGEIQQAMAKLTVQMDNKFWGNDGIFSKMSDTFDKLLTPIMGEEKFSDSGFLLTENQKDENYAGYTEFAGLFLEDMHDTEGSLLAGFSRMMGGEEGRDFVLTLSPEAKKGLQSMADFSSGKGIGGLTRSGNSRLQASMKNNKKDWQALAKEVAKYEAKNGAVKDWRKDTGVKRLEGLVKKLATETGLSRLQVLQAQSLQQMQDMYTIAQQTFVPLSIQQAEAAANHYQLATNGINPNSNQAANGAMSTYEVAQSIAAMVSVIAQSKAIEAAYNSAIMAGEKEALEAGNATEYLKTGIGKSRVEHLSVGWDGIHFSAEGKRVYDGGNKQVMDNIYTTFETMGEMARNPQWTEHQALLNAQKKLKTLQDESGNWKYDPNTIFKTIRENYAGAITPQILGTYLASNLGESDGSGGGGGGGSGSGSGDKDKSTGTRRERVDLVLCSKKEIPKLNVNLFKKPPSFTILNKNFKLRDVKINSEDKPKAIMAAIKNSFIDIQKRTDPKIIQDEDAVYDPKAATDGTNVPSGSAKTKTDNNNS